MEQTNSPRRGVLSSLGAFHDLVSRISFDLATVMLAAIVFSFTYEVVARYAFAAPTEWAVPVVSYLLAAAIFLAMPELTRTSSHVSVNVLLENASPGRTKVLLLLIRTIAAAACLFGAWISAEATMSQYATGISTVPPLALPKWIISIFVPLGMLSSGIYFLRQLVSGAPASSETGEQL